MNEKDKRDRDNRMKDIEILSDKLVNEVAAMTDAETESLYDEMGFDADPTVRVQQLARRAAETYGARLPAHVQMALKPGRVKRLLANFPQMRWRWLAAKLNPKDWSLGLEIRPPRSPAEKLVLRDRGFRLVLIPAVGGAIAYSSGFFGPYRPGSALFWAGLLWAIFMSFVLWHANRSSFRIQRQRYDGFQHRLPKMCVLLLINLFLTVPLTWLMLKMWYFFAGLGPDLTRILIATLCGVAVITHGYDLCFWFSADNTDSPTSL